jgi:hypothetical protein
MALDQEQDYEETFNSPVAIKERVNGFELIVS